MRPIRLEFAGLQSYREPQEIDFGELMGAGLFGIFGPTGAGKSTILDAITLALYGRVERTRGTMGIMNQNENRLWVKFTFALGGTEYRVERSYRREKDTPSIRSEHARLVRVRPEGDEVMADRERDVTQQVTDLLGLQLDDFTRAVVLPQGQFAEFLKLTGARRTEMLQRIFALTQYGDVLNQRLKRRVEAVERQLEAVNGEQKGLGDASAEAVAEAEEALRQVAEALEEAERHLADTEAQVKVWERVWQQQQELAQVAQELARWEAQAPDADAARAELDAARRADAVRPHLDARDQAAAAAHQAEQGAALAEQRLQDAQAEVARAARAYAAARQRRLEEAPALTRRQADLQRAVELEGGLEPTRRKLADGKAQVAEMRARYDRIDHEIKQGEARLGTMRTQIAELEERVAQLEVPPELRNRVTDAHRMLDRLREAERSLEQAEQRFRQRMEELARAQREAERAEAMRAEAEQRLQQVETELARLEAEPPADEADLQAHGAWLGRAGEQIRTLMELAAQCAQRQAELDARTRECEEATARLRQAVADEERQREALAAAQQAWESARAAVAAARQRAHAAALARALEPGQPCPVCGSREHPHPVGVEAATDLEAEETELEQAAARLRAAESALGRASERRLATEEEAAAAARRRADAEQALAEVRQVLEGARERLPAAWRALPVAELEDALARDAADHDARARRFAEWRRQVDSLRQQRQECRDALYAAASDARERQAAVSHAEQALVDVRSEADALRSAVDRCTRDFDAARGDLDAAGVEAAVQSIREADERLAVRRRRLIEIRTEYHDLENMVGQFRQEATELAEQLHRIEVLYAQALQQYEASAAEWQRLSGGRPAAPQLVAVEAALARLEQDEEQAAAARERAERARSQAEAARAAARRELEMARRRAVETDAALAEALAAAGFASAEEARGALRPAERQAALDGLIRRYEQEGERLKGRQAALQQQLAGRSLSPEAWQGWLERLEQARQIAARQREERARAMQIRDDLLAKQQRWHELEEQRLDLTTQLGHLEELRKVLKGNAFVNFMAQEKMERVALDASRRLRKLTRDRYALETAPDGSFRVRDETNGGALRSVSTLSGGETFLASLSLALALSAQIQLHGHYPLEFFFLDEGFGTLDPELLDVVISTLERLHFDRLNVGVISHVAELRNRLHRRVIVEPAEPGGRGSRLRLERA